jgi:hypothetical protein
MKRQTRILALITAIILFITGCNTLKTNNNSLVFSVMGDIPRSEAEKVILQEQIQQHNERSQAQFVFHVGDIKSGKSPCYEDNYKLVAGYLKQMNVPVFIIPGDNEWNDCEHPDQAWNYWNKYFKRFDQNWEVSFEVQRQKNYPVNIAFVQNDVLFIALNMVGGRIHDQAEWDKMLQNAVEWVNQQLQKKEVLAAVILAQANPDDKHKLFMDQFLPIVKSFRQPVLLIHGDGHEWIFDETWQVPNLMRIQVDKGGIADPLQVTVTGNKNKIFEFERYPFLNIE